ncbi:MAG TPA: hypothetical protein VFI13_10990 [Gemmatimonadales bacterium]|nr:hypothetical protein [Gemmatimonadales bacterium]
MTPLRTLLPILLLAACGGGGGPSDDPGGGGAVVVLQKAVVSGEGQSGVVADTLGAPLAVLVGEGGVPAPVADGPTHSAGAAMAPSYSMSPALTITNAPSTRG